MLVYSLLWYRYHAHIAIILSSAQKNTYPYAAILFIVHPLDTITTDLNLVRFYVIIIIASTEGSYFRDLVCSTQVYLNPLFVIISLNR